MKKLIVLAVLIGAVLMALFSFNKKGLTLAQLQKKKPAYEDLISVLYYSGGGMDGSSLHQEIRLEEDGKIYYRTEASQMYSFPLRVFRYEVKDSQAMAELKDYVRKYNMSIWDQLPDSDEEVLDAPSTGLDMGFKVEGSRFTQYVRIPDYKLMTSEEAEVWCGLREKMNSYARDAVLLETYIEDRYSGEKIYWGRDIENSDEEADLLLQGYWFTEDRATLECNGKGIFYLYSIYEEDESEYSLKEIVHEPYKDCDSSWYAVIENPGHVICLAVDGTDLIAEDSEGFSGRFSR